MSAPEATAEQQGSFVDANGVHTYYEVDGSGEPLVLLVGGLCAIETLASLRAELAAHYRVYLPERRGHGRTPDDDGPFTFEGFADDTAAFMDAVGLDAAHIVGFSDGATVGLFMALRRPELVRSLTHIGQPVNPSGIQPEFQEVMKLDSMPQGILPPILRELYEALSPDGPEHWDVVTAKAWHMWVTSPDLGLEELAAVQAPTLVMVADNDIPTVEHASEMAEAIADGEVVVIENATHGLPMEKPDVVGGVVTKFLADRARMES